MRSLARCRPSPNQSRFFSFFRLHRQQLPRSLRQGVAQVSLIPPAFLCFNCCCCCRYCWAHELPTVGVLTNSNRMSQCLFSDDTAVLVAGLGGICAVFVVFASCACLCSCCRSRQIWTTVAAAEAAHVRAGTGVLVAPPVSSYEQHETAVFYFCCGQERVQFFCPVLRMVVDACQVTSVAN